MTNPLYIPPALPVDRPGPSQSFKPSHAPADPALLALLLGYWLAADALATRLIASRCWCSPSRVEVRTGHRDRPCSSSVACAPVGAAASPQAKPLLRLGLDQSIKTVANVCP
jgi:hypothetical protein